MRTWGWIFRHHSSILPTEGDRGKWRTRNEIGFLGAKNQAVLLNWILIYRKYRYDISIVKNIHIYFFKLLKGILPKLSRYFKVVISSCNFKNYMICIVKEDSHIFQRGKHTHTYIHTHTHTHFICWEEETILLAAQHCCSLFVTFQLLFGKTLAACNPQGHHFTLVR